MFNWDYKSASWYVSAGLIEPYGKDIAKAISKYTKGMEVVEIGCGPGITTKYISENCKSILGIDKQEYIIDFAKEKWANVSNMKFERMDAKELSKECCDVVCAISFGDISNIVNVLFDAASKYLIIVSGMKRQHLPKKSCANLNEKFFIENEIIYEKFEIETSFGQAFKTFDEAIEFTKFYEIAENNEREFLKENLVEISGEYSFLLKNKKTLGAIVVDLETIKK